MGGYRWSNVLFGGWVSLVPGMSGGGGMSREGGYVQKKVVTHPADMGPEGILLVSGRTHPIGMLSC